MNIKIQNNSNLYEYESFTICKTEFYKGTRQQIKK